MFVFDFFYGFRETGQHQLPTMETSTLFWYVILHFACLVPVVCWSRESGVTPITLGGITSERSSSKRRDACWRADIQKPPLAAQRACQETSDSVNPWMRISSELEVRRPRVETQGPPRPLPYSESTSLQCSHQRSGTDLSNPHPPIQASSLGRCHWRTLSGTPPCSDASHGPRTADAPAGPRERSGRGSHPC